MRSFLALGLFFTLVAASPNPTWADHGGRDDEGDDDRACGTEPHDREAVAATREEAARKCDCAGARDHDDYVECVTRVARRAVRKRTLRKACVDVVVGCADQSTCGRRDAVTCCQTDARGRTRCSIKKSGTKCTAPSGGQACVGSESSCCDACLNGSCGASTTTRPPTTTTRPPTTTTTTPTSTTTSSTTASTTTTAPPPP